MLSHAHKAMRILLFGIWCSLACEGDTKPQLPAPFVVHLQVPPMEAAFSAQVDQGQVEALPADAFGWRWKVSGGAKTLILQRDGEELDRLTLPGQDAWFFAGSPAPLLEAPPELPNADELVIYFIPPQDPAERQWGLHLWDAITHESLTEWSKPQPLIDTGSAYGQVARVRTSASKLGVIVHDGDLKAAEQDIYVESTRSGRMIFLGPGRGKVFCSPSLGPCGWQPEVEGGSAHWVSARDLLWKVDVPAARYLLLSSAEAILDMDHLRNAEQNPQVVTLELSRQANPGAGVLEKFPHLADFTSFRLPERDLSPLMKAQLIVVALNEQGRVLAATRPQLGGVLDENFAYAGDLGFTGPELKLWAPTAQEVKLKVYAADKTQVDVRMMSESRGLWKVSIPADWVAQQLYYRFAVKLFHPSTQRIESYEVSDPYALSGSHNGTYSQFVDIHDPRLKPAGWDTRLPAIPEPTDMVFYEMHIRDFSIWDPSVPKESRGTYQAFAVKDSLGMQHLRSLQSAGLTHVQVLPAYDFGSVNEDRRQTLNIDDPMRLLCACDTYGSASIRSVFDQLPRDDLSIATWNAQLIDRDSFNWGYDPVHYGMPEGSYVSAGEGAARILEFRTMAQGLQDIGLHLAMDVVYNHTYASGLNPNSVLDRIVPGYYQRLHPITGAVENSSCCENTASERVMMEKLMVDTLKRWHEVYKVDAFRFDLMGLHMKSNMLAIQQALGPDVFLFGEGWSMGEVNGDSRSRLTATQMNMAGTGIATFNDRFRDAVRGGGPMDSGAQLNQQSPVNGLFVDDNGRGTASMEQAKQNVLYLQDRLRLGLAGSLADYRFTSSSGQEITGAALDYFGQKAGYTREPRETINYIENHDNQTYWDINQLKLPYALSLEERARVQVLGLAFNTLAAGVPYFEMGAEFLRSKSLVRDSFNAGDWYNAVDFTFQRHTWNQGLPAADKDGANLEQIRAVIAKVPDRPDRALMQTTSAIFRDLLAIRKDSPLLRLATAAAITQRVESIPGMEAEPGLVTLRIKDDHCTIADLDPRYSEVLVIFNMKPSAVDMPLAGSYALHPLQAAGHDERVKTATSDGRRLRVPARTAAIFVAPEKRCP